MEIRFNARCRGRIARRPQARSGVELPDWPPVARARGGANATGPRLNAALSNAHHRGTSPGGPRGWYGGTWRVCRGR